MYALRTYFFFLQALAWKTSGFHVRYRFKGIPWRATGGSPFECVDIFKYTQEIRRNVWKLRMKHWMIKVFKQLGLKFSSKKMSPATSTYQFRCLPYLNKFAVKFPHSHILHYAFSSWIEKTMTKKYIAIRKTDLFYNSMRLCGNFTKFASIWRENLTHIHAGVKETKIVVWRLHFSSYNSLKPF